MSATTGIEWTEATWNPVVGCDRISPGCAHCYAKTLHDRRHAAHVAGKRVPPQYAEPFERVQLMWDRLIEPITWQRPRLIFVNSVSDLFHEDVPDDMLDWVFAVMALAPQHRFQVLTKRPARMREYLCDQRTYARVLNVADRYLRQGRRAHRLLQIGISRPPAHNVWLGVSVENQRWADERIPLLLQTPAAVRFLSCEPLLGPLLIAEYLGAPRRRTIDWVIAGGESGRDCRPCSTDWLRMLRDQTVSAEVPFFLKQLGGHPNKRGGDEAVLDGVHWQQMPERVA